MSLFSRGVRHQTRSTPLGARGEPMVWLTGLCLTLAILMIAALLVVVVVQGGRAFWPGPIDTVVLQDGSKLMGVPVRDESYDPSPQERAEIAAAQAAGALPPGALDEDGRPVRRLYRVGNRELGGQPFSWTPLHRIASVERDPHATLLERDAWGVWIGVPQSLEVREGDERRVIADGPDAVIEALGPVHERATQRREAIRKMKDRDVGEINAALEAARLELREVEIRLAPPGTEARSPMLSPPAFAAVVGTMIVALLLGVRGMRRLVSEGAMRPSASRVVLAMLCLVIAAGAGLLASLEHPWAQRHSSTQDVDRARDAFEARRTALEASFADLRARIAALEEENSRDRLVIVGAQGSFAPLRQSELDQPMLVSQVIRVVRPNTLDWSGKFAVYLDRWREFLLAEPRESNTEGGIFPVIFGTVVLTILLSVVVVPLGVVAALYLREYARQGLLTSTVRIAVNNLAGVPSIVYGVFGLGFFCYSVGSFVDTGPTHPWPIGAWWAMVGGVAVLVILATLAGLIARPVPGRAQTAGQRRIAWAGLLLWVGCAAMAVAVVAGTPYFEGFFRASAPSPTFGTKGMLWASLTLALLTLPVVIVATEEAISAVPRSMREGSYGCGASKWQTIRRIVLPRAMPGIMTGMILAMARGAGEVAPLMLVGAVKLAPDLPVSADFPFLHLERPFMHLGFHIYDVGFQSPDSEAARPLVWCTTLVLIVLVVLLTTSAIQIRARLRRKYLGDTF